MDVARTLKNSEVDLSKAREELKEMTRARDSIEAGRLETGRGLDEALTRSREIVKDCQGVDQRFKEKTV